MAAIWKSGQCPARNAPTDADDPTSVWESPAGLEAAQGADQAGHELRLRKFGDYENLEEIARGAMGVVYKARQISLNRTVAVKMILSGDLANESDIQRFRIEAEAAAHLQHPNIIGIHDVGQHDGHHFFSMEYVAGENLSQIIRKGSVPPKQAARYVRQIADAIGHAHRKGVTHRDIKPSNVLIDDKDQARFTDFGLAKRVECDQQLTASHQIVGTVPYMAPEQVMGSRDRVGPASDIYSIGVLFYELLTRQQPFRGRTALDTLEQIREHDPKLPRQINPQIPRELEMICLKCLEKNPEKRYGSAQELADDLQRFLDGDSISLSGPSLLDRLLCTLGRGHHDVEFRTWANMLFHFAWIVFAANFLSFLVVGKLHVCKTVDRGWPLSAPSNLPEWRWYSGSIELTGILLRVSRLGNYGRSGSVTLPALLLCSWLITAWPPRIGPSSIGWSIRAWLSLAASVSS